MKEKQESPLKVLFSFSGEAKGRMTLSVLLALAGETAGMAPYFAVALLAKQSRLQSNWLALKRGSHS